MFITDSTPTVYFRFCFTDQSWIYFKNRDSGSINYKRKTTSTTRLANTYVTFHNQKLFNGNITAPVRTFYFLKHFQIRPLELCFWQIYTVKKGGRLSRPQPGCHWTIRSRKLLNKIKLFPSRESLVSGILAGDRKIDNLFSQCSRTGKTWKTFTTAVNPVLPHINLPALSTAVDPLYVCEYIFQSENSQPLHWALSVHIFKVFNLYQCILSCLSMFFL